MNDIEHKKQLRICWWIEATPDETHIIFKTCDTGIHRIKAITDKSSKILQLSEDFIQERRKNQEGKKWTPKKGEQSCNGSKPKTHYYNPLNRVYETENSFPKYINFWSHTITHLSNFLDSTEYTSQITRLNNNVYFLGLGKKGKKEVDTCLCIIITK